METLEKVTNVLSERENRFMIGYEDGLRDKREKTGRALGGEDSDYGAGYISAKYNQLLGFRVENVNEALDIQISQIWCPINN